MIRAKLKVYVSDRSMARSLLRAAQPDHVGLPGLRIVGRDRSRSAEFRIAYQGKLETFISSLDDLLRCLKAAKDTLDRITESRKEGY